MGASDTTVLARGVRLAYVGALVALAAVIVGVAGSLVRQPLIAEAATRALGVMAMVLTLMGEADWLICRPPLPNAGVLRAATLLQVLGFAGQSFRFFLAGLPYADAASTASAVAMLVGLALLWEFLNRTASIIDRPDLANMARHLTGMAASAAFLYVFAVARPVTGQMVTGLFRLALALMVCLATLVYVRLMGGFAKATRVTPASAEAPTEPEAPPAAARPLASVPKLALWVLVLGCGATQLLGLAEQLQETAPGGAEIASWKGKRCPDFTIHELDGKTLTLAGLHGQPIILNFWATWCPPCRAELPHFQSFATQAGDILLIGLSDEDPAKVRPFVQKQGLTFPIGRLINPPRPFDAIEALPTTVVIDRRGVIRTVHVGYCSPEQLTAYAAAVR